MIRFVAGALAAIVVTGTAQAALSPTDIVNRHTSSGGNIDAIMADYADDAIVLQAGKAYQGKAEIRPLFEKMFAGRPAAPAPSPGAPPAARPAGGMKVTKVWQEGDVGLMTWTAGPMSATEEFLVRDGKIKVQAIFLSRTPDAAPAK
ncbi:nuclear transport factor 2 family protein [Sphingomonas sp. MMS24-J13]|uniref:nuclear transport factor 2 family protein n=1 Tax=Sphingomonas sp. MMS24-J13 TaxID=3238686 RepID=UPI00384B8A6E